MSRRLAFTLVEVITVLAIIIVLAALSYPTFASARKRAYETTCIANLRQVYVALSLYRSDWSGDAVNGKPSEMGLPLDLLALQPSIDRYTCHGVDPYNCGSVAGGGGLWKRWPSGLPQFSNPAADAAWAAYVGRYGESAVLIIDPNHQFSCPLTEFSTGRAAGLRLDGSAAFRIRYGDPTIGIAWWHDD